MKTLDATWPNTYRNTTLHHIVTLEMYVYGLLLTDQIASITQVLYCIIYIFEGS